MGRVQRRQNQISQMSEWRNKKQQRKFPLDTTESQSGWCGKAPIEVILSSSPSQSGSPKTWLPSTILRQLLNISKDGNTAISAGNLFQCSSHCSMNIRKTLVHHEVDRPLVERGGRISSLEVLKSPRHSATCFNWSYSEQRIRPDDLQRSLPTQILLGFSGILFINQSLLSGHKATEQQKISQ